MAVYLVMLAHNIPGMKRKKMENGLVSAMIHDYMAATTSASSQRLASFLGDDGGDDQPVCSAVDLILYLHGCCCIGMKRESISMTREAEQEFERRMEEFFSEIFPQHAQCHGSCRGHQLPSMANMFMKEMGYPVDLKDLTIAARSWYERIDLDASGSIDRCKVLMLTGARAHTQARTNARTHTHTHLVGKAP